MRRRRAASGGLLRSRDLQGDQVLCTQTRLTKARGDGVKIRQSRFLRSKKWTLTSF